MRSKGIFIACFLAFALNRYSTAQSPADSVSVTLNSFLDQWHRDAADADLPAYIGAMSDDAVFIGTDATEYWTTAEFNAFCKPYFDRKTTWNFIPLSRHVYVGKDGNTAWFDELLNTQMGVCRGSGALQKYPDEWKIEQYVLSATIPNEQMNKVTRNKSGIDSSLVLKSIFDKYGMDGTILIHDPVKNLNFGYNRARWDSGYLPASTFKIPNTLIGLETGAIDTGYVFAWDGKRRALPQWNHEMGLREAFRLSCVPCYQELAVKIGVERMAGFLEKFNYGLMDVGASNIDRFWLEGNSRITPRQQIMFLQQLYEEKLPLKSSTMKAVKSIMVNETTPEYRLSGKTGWAIRNGINYGWFVGWIETNGQPWFIATLIEPKNNEKISDFAAARKTITMDALRVLGMIP